MTDEIISLGPTQQAELANAKRKHRATLRARCALIGQVLRIVHDDERGEIFEVGSSRFVDAESLEEWLDLRGDAE